MGSISIRTLWLFFFFFQAEDGIRDDLVTGVQTCALPILCSFFAAVRFSISIARSKSALATIEGREKMDSTSQWQALKVALQREAEDIFYSAGEVVVVESSGISRSEERRVGKECRSRWSPY